MENKKHGEDKILQGRRVMNGSVHKQCIVEINEHRSVEYKLMLYFLPTAQSIGVSRVSGKLTATDYVLY